MTHDKALVEWVGWGTLVLLTLTIVALAALRPTDSRQVVNEIRLAAGFDRYETALQEGNRVFSRAIEHASLMEGGDPGDARLRDQALARAEEHFLIARSEAEGNGEDWRVQARLADLYYSWARVLLEEATGHWYERNDIPTLERARELVDKGLALPDISPAERGRLEKIGGKIDRAITPWPII